MEDKVDYKKDRENNIHKLSEMIQEIVEKYPDMFPKTAKNVEESKKVEEILKKKK